MRSILCRNQLSVTIIIKYGTNQEYISFAVDCIGNICDEDRNTFIECYVFEIEMQH